MVMPVAHTVERRLGLPQLNHSLHVYTFSGSREDCDDGESVNVTESPYDIRTQSHKLAC